MQLRTHVVMAVLKRNFQSYFSGVIGYLFIVVFVGACAAWAFSPEFFANNLANLDQLNQWFPWLLLFIVPAITMGTWAEERKQGTDELLFTLPATDLEILLGKYLAALAIYSVALLLSLLFCAVGVLGYLTTFDFDWGLILTNYFGFWIAGAALISAGMLGSVLTSSVTVAFIVGTLLCLIPVAIDKIALTSLGNLLPGRLGRLFQIATDFLVDKLGLGSAVFQNLSIGEQLRDFGMGMIPLSGIFYFISFTLLMLYLNLVMISKRHWSGGPHGVPMGLHYIVRGCSLALILLGLNVVAANGSSRKDMTSEHIYTVFPTTRKTLEEIKPDRPVFIQAFISPVVPREYVSTRSNLIGLLRQFDQIAGSKLKVRIVETEPFTDAAEEAKRYGIQPQQVQTQRGGKIFVDSVFLGAVVSSGADDEVVVPFFDVGTPVEYELTRSVRTVAEAKRLKVGILTTDARLAGGMDTATFSNSPEWRIVTELKKQYDVEPNVSADAPISGDYDVLIAAMPSSLTDPQLDNLVDYIKQGKPTLIFDDPLPFFRISLAPRKQKPSPGGGMFGQNQPPVPKADNGKATRLIKELGIKWDNGQVVFDNYTPHPEFAELWPPEFVFVSTKGGGKTAFNEDSPITSGLQELVLLYSGTISPGGTDNDLTFTPLMRTSRESGTIDWNQLVEDQPSFFGMGGTQIRPDPPHEIDGKEHILAAHVSSKSKEKDGPPGINVIYAADLDMISDIMFRIREREPNELKLDNVTFVLNAVDVLAGDTSLVDLRKRRAEHRTLTAVEARTAAYVRSRTQERQKAEEKAQKALEEAKKRLADERKKIEEDQSIDPRMKQVRLMQVQEQEQRRLTVAEVEIENAKQKEIEKSKAKSEREIRRIENRIRFLAIVLPPIPVLLLGLVVFFIGRAAERRTIIPDRQIKHGKS